MWVERSSFTFVEINYRPSMNYIQFIRLILITEEGTLVVMIYYYYQLQLPIDGNMYIYHYQGPDLYAFIGFIGTNDDDIN